MPTPKPTTIDEYIAGFPKDTQEILQAIRSEVSKAAPKAEEAIKYGMPTFVMKGNLVHFATFKNHIGFYPAPVDVAEFKEAIAPYLGAKSSLRFPLNEPIPMGLIKKVVKYRVKLEETK